MTQQPEFSRPISVEGITPDKERTENIEANDKECAALAERFDLRGLSDFKTTMKLRRVGGGTLRVEGKLSAEVIQTCVVSLQDVHAHVEGKFETYFTEEALDLPEEIDLMLDDGESTPEMIVGGMVDMGEVAAQYLSLNLDPYPRAPGVSLAAQLAEIGGDVRNSPFEMLQAAAIAQQAEIPHEEGGPNRIKIIPRREKEPREPKMPRLVAAPAPEASVELMAKVLQPTEARMARLKWYPPIAPVHEAAMRDAAAANAANAPAAETAAAVKPAAKKPAKKAAVKKAPAKKAPAKKAVSKKASGKKAPAKKTASKAVKKSAAKKTVKKAAPKKAKVAVKKPVKKAAKKVAARKAAPKKPLKKLTKKVAQKAAKKTVKKAAKKAAKKPAPKAAKKTAPKMAKKAVKKAAPKKLKKKAKSK